MYRSSTLAAAALLLIGVSAARADDCAVPSFNPEQHTYLSSTLEQDAQLSDQLAGLSAELVAAGNASGHQIAPYFVACQMSYQSGVPGVVLSHNVYESWKSIGAFPWQSRVVVIAWVRNGYDKSHGSIGATAGQPLQDLGFTGDYFASSNGPILRDVRQFMPDNPKGEFVNIVRFIDSSVDSQIDAQREAVREDEALGKFFTGAVQLVGLILALGLIVWLLLRLTNWLIKRNLARGATRKNDARVSTMLKQVQTDSEALANLGMRCDEQLAQVEQLLKQQEEVRNQMRWYPLESVQASEELTEKVEELQDAVRKSLTLLGEILPALQNGIASARETATYQRKQVVSFAFPGASSAADSGVLFKLNSIGGNPDDEIARALENIAVAYNFLVDGEVDKAQKQYDAAGTRVQNASSMGAKVLDAKAGAEAIVSVIRDARVKLLASCDLGGQPLGELKSEFASVNFQDVGRAIEEGRTTANSVQAVINNAAELYFQQDFLAAKSRLDGLLQNLNSAKSRVESIAVRLTELREKRAAVLGNLATAEKQMTTVGAKLKQNSHASQKTRRAYDALQEQHRNLNQVSDSNSAVNWLVMYALWQTINTGTGAVSRQIDSDRSSYESHQRALESARSSYSTSIDTSSTMSMGGGSGGGNY